MQSLATHAVLDGDNCVILAPAVGGKTESAFFPVLSAMDSAGWEEVPVLYVAPTRAPLTTPESLEAMMISPKIPCPRPES